MESYVNADVAKSDQLLTDTVDLADSLRDMITSLKQVVKISNGWVDDIMIQRAMPW